jgi:hypothetical protein
MHLLELKSDGEFSLTQYFIDNMGENVESIGYTLHLTKSSRLSMKCWENFASGTVEALAAVVCDGYGSRYVTPGFG